MSYLEIRGLTKRYGRVTALSDIDLDVERGSRMAIVGPSGSGKTTLLRLIAGFEIPDYGSIALDGTTIAGNGTALPAHKRGIGVVAQDGALFPHLSVGENIGFGLARNDPTRQKRIEELAETVGLNTSMLQRRPDQISGGQQQRVAIARALARKPRIMLLDEPFSALDTSLRGAMRKAVAEILDAAGIASILVTHDQAEALSFADRVAVLNNGLLEQSGSPDDLYFRPRNRTVAEFLGEAIIVPAQLENGTATCAFGQIRSSGPHKIGPTRVMIRPGQLSLARVAPTDCRGCLATVIGIEFAGPQCSATLILDEAHGSDHTANGIRIVLPISPYDRPQVNETVWLAVSGTAHPID